MKDQTDKLAKLLDCGWEVTFYTENERMPLHCHSDQKHKTIHHWKAKFGTKEYSNQENTEPLFIEAKDCINDFIDFGCKTVAKVVLNVLTQKD